LLEKFGNEPPIVHGMPVSRLARDRREQARTPAETLPDFCSTRDGRGDPAIAERMAQTASCDTGDDLEIGTSPVTSGAVPVALRPAQVTRLALDRDLLRHAVDQQRDGFARDPAMDGRSYPLCVRDQSSGRGLMS